MIWLLRTGLVMLTASNPPHIDAHLTVLNVLSQSRIRLHKLVSEWNMGSQKPSGLHVLYVWPIRLNKQIPIILRSECTLLKVTCVEKICCETQAEYLRRRFTRCSPSTAAKAMFSRITNMTKYPISSPYKAPFAFHCAYIRRTRKKKCAVEGEAEMKEKPSSLNKENVASRAN